MIEIKQTETYRTWEQALRDRRAKAQAEWQRSQRGPCPYDGLYVGWFGRFQTATKVPLKKTR